MSVIDEQGRLFGRVNLIDAFVVLFVLGLIPMAYGTALLFQPAAAQAPYPSKPDTPLRRRSPIPPVPSAHSRPPTSPPLWAG